MYFYILLLFLLFPSIVVAQTPTVASVDRISPTVTTCSAYTSCPTMNIGGSATTVNIAPSTAPASNTINIGGTGSTVNIGPIPSATPTVYPVVTVMGVSPRDYFAVSAVNANPTATPFPALNGLMTVSLPVTSLNPRKGTPTPAPTVNAYIITCNNSVVVHTGITFAPTGNDCILFPRTGIYRVDFSLLVTMGATASGYVMRLYPAPTPNPAPTPMSRDYLFSAMSNGANGQSKVSAFKHLSITSLTGYNNIFYFGTYAPTTSASIQNAYALDLSIQYMGPP